MRKRSKSRISKDLGAFETSFEMLKVAEKNKHDNVFLNAGRGNPNWINVKARLAFNRIVEFGIFDSYRTIRDDDLAGYTQLNGIKARFEAYLDPDDNEIDEFLLDVLNYAKNDLLFNMDEFVKELIDGALGNNYPVPSKCLKYTEKILNDYLEKTLYNGVKLADKTEVFPTEGGTAAIVYIFNSLKRNKLIKPGDKIAINTPIFTPYLQIPELAEYELVEVFVSSTEQNNWEITIDEIEKLADPEIKAFFIVNPSNPGSKSLNKEALEEIKNATQKNPDLMVITDDVYGTFVNNFQTVYSIIPHNTILVYSYSKLFGATGWRVGLIAMHQDNVFDRLIKELSDEEKNELDIRYNIVTHNPEELSFMDRVVADSRSVGLYHTSGLSTPQQIMEVLFSLTHLINKDKEDLYFKASKNIVDTRYQDLHKAMKVDVDNSDENAKYYSMLNIFTIAQNRYGKEFRDYLEANFDQVDFLLSLADRNGVVLMDGVGFGSANGNLRVSQANLPTEDYNLIGKQIIATLRDYYQEYKDNK